MQEPEKSPKIAISAPSHNFVGLYLRNQGTYRQSEKNLLSSNMSSRCPPQYGELRPLAAEIVSLVWGAPANFNGFRVLACSDTARQSSSGRQPNFAAFNKGRHLCSAGRPSRSALAHILVLYLFFHFVIFCRNTTVWAVVGFTGRLLCRSYNQHCHRAEWTS